MRKLSNFIKGFLQYTEGKGSPRLYRLWTALYVVGAALERKVWITTNKGKTYANQYLLLVGPAGVGKSLCTRVAYDLFQSIRSPESPFHVAPTSVTKASLVDGLAKAERRVVRPLEVPSINQFNSLSIIVNEFGVFLPSWEGEFMAALTDLWDNGRYAETRRTNKIDIEIANAQLNLLSATTPAQLMQLLPEGAWDQGFMSRILIIFSSEVIIQDFFAEFPKDKEIKEALEQDLKVIYGLWGSMQFTDEVKIAITEWAESGGQPKPDHPKLYSYCSRRAHHLFKLCMIASVSDSDDLIITFDHFAEALGWLEELERHMPEVFKSMQVGGDSEAMTDCWHHCYKIYVKTKLPVPESEVYTFLQARRPAYAVERILEVMKKSGLFKEAYTKEGTLGYIPQARSKA